MGASLRRTGLNPSAPKPGPDFQVIVERAPIFIEAIAPTAGAPLHPDAVQDPVYTNADGEAMAAQVPHDLITLRLATAFRTKANAFDGYRRKGYVGAGDACIIAMNLRAIPHAWADAEEFWFRAMYGAAIGSWRSIALEAQQWQAVNTEICSNGAAAPMKTSRRCCAQSMPVSAEY